MDERLMAVLRSQWSALHALLYRLTLRQEAAEELLQELFLKLSRSDGFAVAENPAAFAYRAAVNLAIDWRRQRKRDRAVPPIVAEAVDAQQSALDRIIDHERVERILEALQYLPEISRQVVVLRFIQDWQYQEIGSAIGKTAHQARAICHDAVVMLRRRLSPNQS